MTAHAGPLKVALAALNQPGYQSLALGYIRAYAEAHPRLQGKAAFQTLDLTTDLDPWWVAYRVLGLAPDVVAFSVMCWSAQKIQEACRVIKEASPDTVIVLGGPEVGPVAEEVLTANRHVDAVVRGEGEDTFAELLRVLTSGKRMHLVAGVTARDGDDVVSAPDRPLISDLDTIPSPYLTGILVPVDGGAYLETYRGCPYRCGYCFEGKGYGRIRHFSRERVKAEIDAVAASPGITNFSLIDSVFNLTEERLRWFAEVMRPHKERGVRLHTIEVDIERLDTAAAGLLVSAGVASVETGPQSVGKNALATCHRPFDARRFTAGLEALKRAGISVECDLIVGLPGDEVYDFLSGLRFAIGLDPGIVQTSTLHVLPGTPFWEDAEELGLHFDPQAPHEVIATEQASYHDLRRAEILALSVQKTYRARV